MGTIFVNLVLFIAISTWYIQFLKEKKLVNVEVNSLNRYLIALTVWNGMTYWLAHHDFYMATTKWLSLDIAILVPFFLTGISLIQPNFRSALKKWISYISLEQLIWIQGIRIVAIGSIIKMIQGEMPSHFVLGLGLPDFLFGLSVPFVAANLKRINQKLLICWNMFGILIFIPALILFYLSVPSPFQYFFDEPTTHLVFEFPMAAVPTIIVPLFILFHIISMYKIRKSWK